MRHLHGTIQNYAWGSTTSIPELFGIPATGGPVAEYWLGAHASSPASFDDGTPLDAALHADPTPLGAASRAAFGDRLPFLLKVLAAAQPLSLQSHPSRQQAEEGFARENAAGIPLTDPRRTYKDDWPKPEMVVALTEYYALCGFRDPGHTLDLCERLGLMSVFGDLLGPLGQRTGEAALAEVFLNTLQRSGDAEATLELKAAAERHQHDDGELGHFARTALRLVEFYPGDPGVLAGLLMNAIVLHPGEALHLGAGNLHCYLEGTGIEIMANSDNVIRGGLTNKHIDVDELVRVVSFRPGPPDLVEPVTVAPGLVEYPAHQAEFRLWRFDVNAGQSVEVPGADGARIVLLLDGDVSDEHGVALTRAQSGFVAADEVCTLSGCGSGFIAAAGV